ncbi:MAG: L-threonylcarbamoyladenylate synthase [Gemmatimonadota bacterium]
MTLRRADRESWGELDNVAAGVSRHLSLGGLLAHPTTGVYGLGGRRENGVESCLTLAKGREQKSGFVYLVADASIVRTEFPDANWPPLAAGLAREFWPGALTLVLDDGTDAGVAIRAEAHPVTRAILGRWAGAISSTSLNRAGEPAAATELEAQRILSDMPAIDRPVLFLATGRLPGPPPSTVVRIHGEVCEVVREGAVSAARIREALP